MKDTTIAKANKTKKFVVKMSHFYRKRWIEKWVSLESVVEWTRKGKYERRVNAARGLELVQYGEQRRVWKNYYYHPEQKLEDNPTSESPMKNDITEEVAAM